MTELEIVAQTLGPSQRARAYREVGRDISKEQKGYLVKPTGDIHAQPIWVAASTKEGALRVLDAYMPILRPSSAQWTSAYARARGVPPAPFVTGPQSYSVATQAKQNVDALLKQEEVKAVASKTGLTLAKYLAAPVATGLIIWWITRKL